MRCTKTKTQKGLLMIASPSYHQNSSREKLAPTLLKYVTQRSLAVAMFVALALLASVGNKPSDKKEPGLTSSFTISQQREQTSPSLSPRKLFDNVLRSVKDAFDDPELVQYANDQRVWDWPTLHSPTDSSEGSAENVGNKCASNR